MSLHHEQFEAAAPDRVAAPPAPDAAAALSGHLKRELQGIGLFNRAGRREAKQRARILAEQEVAAGAARNAAAHRSAQVEADARWAALRGHRREPVLGALEEAFEDNQSPAACIDVDTEAGVRYATVLIMFGSPDLVPEQTPSLTPTGRPTLRKRTKTDRNALYAAALGSTVLATVKEGLAVAPSVEEFRVIVVRKDPAPATASGYLSAVFVGRFHRRALDRADWGRVDPAEALLQATGARLTRRGSAKEIVPLDVTDDPDLRALLDQLRPNL